MTVPFLNTSNRAEEYVRGVLAFAHKAPGKQLDLLEPYSRHPEDPATVRWFIVNTRMQELAPVREEDVRKYGLRPGDPVTLHNGQVVNPPPANRDYIQDFQTVKALYPNRPVWLTNPAIMQANPVLGHTCRALEAVMGRIGYGQRLLIQASAETGKTTLMESLLAAFVADREFFPQNEKPVIMALLVGERPEELTLFTDHEDIEIWFTPADADTKLSIRSAMLAMERAKRLMEMGRHVVMAVDSLTRLGRFLNETYVPKDEAPGQGGMFTPPLQALNRVFMGARRLENGGSLTIIGTVLADTDDRGDARIENVMKSASNASIVAQGFTSNTRKPDLRSVGWPALLISGCIVRQGKSMRSYRLPTRTELTPEELFDATMAYRQTLLELAANQETGPVEALRKLLTDLESTPDSVMMYQMAQNIVSDQMFRALKDTLNRVAFRMVEVGGSRSKVASVLLGILKTLYSNEYDVLARWLHSQAEEIEDKIEQRASGNRKHGD